MLGPFVFFMSIMSATVLASTNYRIQLLSGGIMLNQQSGQKVFIPLPGTLTTTQRLALINDLESPNSEVVRLEISDEKVQVEGHGETPIGYMVMMQTVVTP